MNADDFQDLYKLLRGSRSAMRVLDARTLFLDNKMVKAFAKLSEARDSYLENRSRLLRQDVAAQVDPNAKDAAKQIKKLKRKQDKALKIIESFDELMPAMERFAAREQDRLEKAEAEEDELEPQHADDARAETPESEVIVARRDDVTKEFSQQLANCSGDRRLDMISRRFGFREVSGEEDIHGGTLYYIQTGDRSLLVCTPGSEEMTKKVALTNLVEDRPIKPFSRKAFLRLGTSRKMVLLTKQVGGGEPESEVPANSAERGIDQEEDGLDVSMTSASAIDSGEQNVLDTGAFGQLLTVAQRCGLVPGADRIAHVRDREFRMGKYDLAFQTMDAMYSQFTASSAQRTQQLTREDAEIAAGRIKISPKDLQAKRSRDRMQTQEVDRAMRRFQVVLEGLRVLMKTA